MTGFCRATLEGGSSCLACKNMKTRDLHTARFIRAKSFVLIFIRRRNDLTPLFLYSSRKYGEGGTPAGEARRLRPDEIYREGYVA